MIDVVLAVLAAYLIGNLVVIRSRRKNRQRIEDKEQAEQLQRYVRRSTGLDRVEDRKALAQRVKAKHPTANRHERRAAARRVQRNIYREISQGRMPV